MTLGAFIHQKPYEKIEFMLRKHLIVMMPPFLLFMVLLIVPYGLKLLFESIYPEMFLNTVMYAVAMLVASIYYLSVGLFFYTYFVTFYLDLLIVTNDRLIHIEQHGLFARSISELDLYKIQDATSEVNGFFASVFRYGTIQIQTAGAVDKFTGNYIPHPEHLRQRLLDLAEIDRKHHHQNEKEI